MQLPPALREALAREVGGHPTAPLRQAVERLSRAYREASEEGRTPRVAACGAEFYAAYLAVRMPATFAAAARAMRWSREAWETATGEPLEPRSVLDLGSGPGTGLWAAALEFPSLERATALERDLQFIAVAQRLCADGAEWGEPPLLLRNTRWITGDLNAALGDEIDGSFDLVLCSYALNELTAAQRKALLERLWNGVTLTLPAAGAGLIDRAWKGTAGILLLVEPGTKAGFANLNAARSVLLDLGAEIVAPCPHKMGCPMAAGGDWCHFAARLERTAEHRRLKAAELGHEDEKFSYLAVRRPRVDAEVSGEKENPRKEAAARIVRHPCVFSGYAQLALCRQGEITEARVTRSMKDDWRRLKRLGWGGLW